MHRSRRPRERTNDLDIVSFSGLNEPALAVNWSGHVPAMREVRSQLDNTCSPIQPSYTRDFLQVKL